MRSSNRLNFIVTDIHARMKLFYRMKSYQVEIRIFFILFGLIVGMIEKY